MTRLVSADDVCAAAEQTLRDHLADVVEAMGWAEDLGQISDWDQVPTPSSLTAATLPTGLITSPGFTSTPVRTSDGLNATWRVGIGVYARGSSYTETARRTRRWAAAVRATILLHRTLGGIARTTRQAGEEYREFPSRGDARTLGGCAVAFDVDVENIVALSLDALTRTVESTHPSVTVRNHQE